MTDNEHIELLRQLIATPSASRDEAATADIIDSFLCRHGAAARRDANNVWALLNDDYDHRRPTLMLNSHHDTVKPTASYTRNPYSPDIENGRLYGLGSNDAGGSVTALIRTFLDLQGRDMPFNLLLAITAEEEVGGENGMRRFLTTLRQAGINIDCAIVGEPTDMQPAVAERGLIVLDCTTTGKTGHAARAEGINAIYRAIADIERLRNLQFPKQSEILGPISLNVTQIEAGRQHNVVPDRCNWVVDCRTTDAYTNEQTVALLRDAVSEHSTLIPRSTRVRASVIDSHHPLVTAATALGLAPFVSPTTSDMSLMHDFPSLKIGPGLSSRSHSADEFIDIAEIDRAVCLYKSLLQNIAANNTAHLSNAQ